MGKKVHNRGYENTLITGLFLGIEKLSTLTFENTLHYFFYGTRIHKISLTEPTEITEKIAIFIYR